MSKKDFDEWRNEVLGRAQSTKIDIEKGNWWSSCLLNLYNKKTNIRELVRERDEYRSFKSVSKCLATHFTCVYR